jgi:hypothetical protein
VILFWELAMMSAALRECAGGVKLDVGVVGIRRGHRQGSASSRSKYAT